MAKPRQLGVSFLCGVGTLLSTGGGYETSSDGPAPSEAGLPWVGWSSSEELSAHAHAGRNPALMPCFSPIKAFRPRGGGPLSFAPKGGWSDLPVVIPCGQCIGCRLERARVWAVRCSHEASLYEDNCFLTLTYSDENLPPLGSLRKQHFVDFMKRFRDRVGYGRVRFFACGEYGDLTDRPHYHALIFNYDFQDKEFYKNAKSGDRLYTSALLDSLWGFGHANIGSVTYESAGYVARYALKKVTGDVAPDHYGGREVEFLNMSRRPGIGARWFGKYSADVLNYDRLVVNGVETSIPRYYDNFAKDSGVAGFAKNKRARRVEGRKAAALPDNSPDRLRARGQVVERRLKIFKRGVL